ncbi:hypothetical protein ACV8SB_17455 [Citrobacter freundii]
MQTINNRMTETQIADLFSLAVQLQVKAEESEDRDTAILAYSIQNACSNLTESRREFWAADATINNLELKITDMAVQLANAERKCRELAAENAELKAALRPSDIPSEWTDAFGDTAVIEHDATGDNQGHSISWSWVGNQEEVIKSVLLAVDVGIKTPATDAFLAEVRASGVDAAIEHLNKKFAGTGHIGVPVMALEWLAQELRKGAEL